MGWGWALLGAEKDGIARSFLPNWENTNDEPGTETVPSAWQSALVTAPGAQPGPAAPPCLPVPCPWDLYFLKINGISPFKSFLQSDRGKA